MPISFLMSSWFLNRLAAKMQAQARDPKRSTSSKPQQRKNWMNGMIASHAVSWMTFLTTNWKHFRRPSTALGEALAWTAAGAALSAALFSEKENRRPSLPVGAVILWGLFVTAESAYLLHRNRSLELNPMNVPLFR
jgi:hypothetical protein